MVINVSYLKEMREKIAKQGRESLIGSLITRKFSFWLTALLVKTPLTANQVTSLSLLLVLAGSVFLAFGNYFYQIVGVVILFIGHVLDYCDGEIARYKGTSSMFGFWWDECTDRIKEYAYILALTIGLFRATQDTTGIFLGMAAGMNILMLHFVRQLTFSKLTANKSAREFKIGKKYYLGVSGTTVYLVIIAVIFKLVYWFLWFYAIVGVLGWLRKIYSSFKFKGSEAGKKEHVWK